jgi:hypothetical protein
MERLSWSFIKRPHPQDRALRAVNQSDFFHPASSHLNHVKARRTTMDPQQVQVASGRRACVLPVFGCPGDTRMCVCARPDNDACMHVQCISGY